MTLACEYKCRGAVRCGAIAPITGFNTGSRGTNRDRSRSRSRSLDSHPLRASISYVGIVILFSFFTPQIRGINLDFLYAPPALSYIHPTYNYSTSPS